MKDGVFFQMLAHLLLILMKDGVFFQMLAHLLLIFPLTNNKIF
jgi:hypothetical protein